jgi:hypothetical protein
MKEQYFKIYDNNNILALVSPTIENVYDYLMDMQMFEDLNLWNMEVNQVRWLTNGWKLKKVLI